MTRLRTLWLILLLLALTTAPMLAQNATPLPPVLGVSGEPANPNANISWPPPVYVLRAQFELRGSANLPNMSNYFIEYRPYSEQVSLSQEEALWFPVSLPSTTAVQNDVLAVWDTTGVPDGIYELRLTVNIAGEGEPIVAYVRPIRVENEPPPFAQTPTQAALTPIPQLIPTLTLPPLLPSSTPIPLPTATTDTTPRATINVANANVRQGDSTAYPVVSSFAQGTSFTIIGISGTGTGWLLVQLPDGRQGWVAPSVVNLSGNTNSLPVRFPPPPPATATPTNTPTPATQANLTAGNVVLTPANPRCAETFNVGFDVANTGSGPTSSSGTVSLQDVHNGAVTQSTIGGFPVLNPGQTFRVQMPLTVDTFYGETHTLVLVINSNSGVPEVNENDNRQTLNYELRKGSCP
jgi:hypothetical protein